MLNIDTHHYPWSKDQEPPDLYRNIEEVQLIQIEHYCQFIQGTCDLNNHAMVILDTSKKYICHKYFNHV